MALVGVACLLLLAKGISAQICACQSTLPQVTILPYPTTGVVDNSVVQSLVDTIQLCVASGVVQNHLSAPPTVKLSTLPPNPVLPITKCNKLSPVTYDLPCINPVPCLDSLINNNCGCNACKCNSCNCNKCNKDILPPCLDALICGNCHYNPCACNCKKSCCPELVLPPLVPQLPCGCGYLPAAAPLVTAAYGAYESCISPLGSCAEAYIPGSIPVVEPILSCGCGLPNCGCGCNPCKSATIATPFCPELRRLAQPIIL